MTEFVSVISMGGTIAMTRPNGGETGAVPALDAFDLLDAVPELDSVGVQLRARAFRSQPGANLGFRDLAELAALITEEVDRGARGVVITQGTDTIEETAFYLDLSVLESVPVVVTGAMRHAGMAGADGPANLLSAVRVAACEQAGGMGCLVVMSDEVHAARYVSKVHTTSTAAFVSPGSGPLGYVVEGVPRLLNRPEDVLKVYVPPGAPEPRVALLTVTLGEDGAVLDCLGDTVDGLVVAAFGAGHVPVALVEPLAKLAERVPVVLASRTGAGPVLTSTYGFPGSEQDLLRRGLVGAGFLAPVKARILLRQLLAARAGTEDIRKAFNGEE
ncbi:asparaginase [Kutzneria viridogrisea]|uniref:Asparaginase/glutaminase n=2 Tax=Kutzneria TaxID=43356 RepID=W5W236_9PSEU|nr:asparaginase [Kutzneria albida]AHH94601.1 asparaginase/glutaminase [Kutzneria albida DSM 43870]MBA8930269.1 L-asparaginase [Kutzneria viridogrisea]